MDYPEKTDYRAFYEVIYPVEQSKKPFYGFQKKRKHHIFFNQRGENSVTTKGEFLITIDTCRSCRDQQRQIKTIRRIPGALFGS